MTGKAVDQLQQRELEGNGFLREAGGEAEGDTAVGGDGGADLLARVKDGYFPGGLIAFPAQLGREVLAVRERVNSIAVLTGL